jgi:hypothetical protein
MESIEYDILRRLAGKGRGRIFFAQEFYDLWPEGTVRYALSALAEKGQIVRLARGVFCFPELSEHGMKMLLPEPDTVAQAVADKARVRIVPVKDQAACLVGLTGLSFNKYVYLTDGAPRKINLSNGRAIEFRHTSEMRIFAFRSRKMMLLSNGIRALGKEHVGAGEREVLKWQLDSVPAEEFAKDIQLCPGWVRDILSDLKAN